MRLLAPMLRGRSPFAPCLLAALAACHPGAQASHASQPGAARAARPSTWRAPPTPQLAQLDRGRYVSFSKVPQGLALVAEGAAAPILVEPGDFPGVRRAAVDLGKDIEKVTSTQPKLISALPAEASTVVIVGTLERSPLLQSLAASNKLGAQAIAGRWEAHLISIVEEPFEGISRALVIAGSDQRGAIYGAYDVSRQIGVSPWVYWDDVPVTPQEEIYVRPGQYSQGEPAVKYRGFFINDEEPQLGRWSRATFGLAPNPRYPNTFDHQLYAHVYEVLLRLKGNYLWPAVWGRSLFDDDPESQALAAEYGIVMGTSHEAPMMRAQHEWDRFGDPDGPYGGTGHFSFVRNEEALKKYWADGLRRMGGFESLITVGMRGNGDTGMEDAAGTELMTRIVSSQREIIRDVLGKDPASVPQVWTLYKEVQDYWDAGMRAPEDVTIIWCDDNWGNLRGLPDQKMALRIGGYGLYYHFDYVGGGRNYKWVDTTLLPNLWEQLHLAYRYGVDRVWMTNVGDLKNEEHPLSFFLDYAWDPERWPLSRLHDWEVSWAAQQFGKSYAETVANVLEGYGNLASLRKPELSNRKITIDPELDLARQPNEAVVYLQESPFSLTNYREMERLVQRWQDLERASSEVRAQLPQVYQDAYYELVHYATEASANLYALRLAQFRNRLYAAQGRAAARSEGQRAEELLQKDRAMSAYYNEELAGGKWTDWQTQPKLGYGGPYPNSSWQQPQHKGQATPDFLWPPLESVDLPAAAPLSVALDGQADLWPGPERTATVPELCPEQSHPRPYLEVVNRGRAPLDFEIETSASWLKVQPASGTAEEQVRVEIAADFSAAPPGGSRERITVRSSRGAPVVVEVPVHVPAEPIAHGFVECDGYISIEAEHADRNVAAGGAEWKLIPDIGRTGGGLTPFPVDSAPKAPGQGPRLEYDLFTRSAGPVRVWAYLSPRNDVLAHGGLRYALSIDDGEPQVASVHGQLGAKPPNRSWERNTSDNTARVDTPLQLDAPGHHVLKLWMIDPTVVVQKLVVDTGGLRESYLGPPESHRAGNP